MIDPMEGFEIEVHFEHDPEAYPEKVSDRLTIRAPWGAEYDSYPPIVKVGFRRRCEEIRDQLKQEREREKAREVYGFRGDWPSGGVDPAQWAMANRGATQAWPPPVNDVKAIQAKIDRTYWNMASRQYAIPTFTIDHAALDLFLGKGLGGGS
jgi:hypothetical protein